MAYPSIPIGRWAGAGTPKDIEAAEKWRGDRRQGEDVAHEMLKWRDGPFMKSTIGIIMIINDNVITYNNQQWCKRYQPTVLYKVIWGCISMLSAPSIPVGSCWEADSPARLLTWSTTIRVDQHPIAMSKIWCSLNGRKVFFSRYRMQRTSDAGTSPPYEYMSEGFCYC